MTIARYIFSREITSISLLVWNRSHFRCQDIVFLVIYPFPIEKYSITYLVTCPFLIENFFNCN